MPEKDFVYAFFKENLDERAFYYELIKKDMFKPAQIADYDGTPAEYFDYMIGSMMAWAYKKGKNKKAMEK